MEVTGTMKFDSNCSFYLPEIECSSRPQKLQLLHRVDGCSIKLPKSNSSITIPIQYEFRGEIFSMGIVSFRSEEKLTEKLSLGIQSPEFLSSLKISLGMKEIVES